MERKASIHAEAVGQNLADILANSPTQKLPWYKQGHLISLNFCIISIVLFSSANGYDGSMTNGLLALPPWLKFMDHPNGSWLGFINASQSLGTICVIPWTAWLVNRFGRKAGIWQGYFWLVVGVALQAGAQSPGMFVAARVCLGLTTGSFVNSAPVLVTEIAYPTHRAVLTAMYNCGWYVGSLVAAWATYGTRNYTTDWAWRIPSLLQTLIPLISFAGFILVPESPRWLISKGRIEEARRILVKHHAGGDEQSPLVAYEMEEIQTTLKLEKEAAQSTSYLDMLKTKGNRHRLFISITVGIFAQWNGNGVVSYYLPLILANSGITSVTSQTLINGCLQIWNLIIAVTAAFLVDHLGRRFLFLFSAIGMFVCQVILSGLSGSYAHTQNKATGLAVVPFLFLFYGAYDVAFTPLIIAYPAEIWNFAFRARGLAVTLFSTYCAVFFNIFVNPIALENIKWKYYIVYSVILVIIIATCYFYYPETRGHSLEEMAVVFDGENAAVSHTRPGDIINQVTAEKGDDLGGDHIEHDIKEHV